MKALHSDWSNHYSGNSCEVITVRHPGRWMIGVSIFTLINVAGAPFAFVTGEPLHGTAHVLLALAGAYVLTRIAPRARSQQLLDARPTEAQLDRLQQSLDVMAVEVERIGEAQRFMTKIVAERAEATRAEPKDEP